MMSLWDALRMNMMISYQELVRTFPNKKHTWNLGIMRDRAQSLRGDCQVRRRETGGTEVIVTFIPEKTFSIQ